MILKRGRDQGRGVLAGVSLLILLFVLTGCMTADQPESGTESAWRTIEVTDVRSGTVFSVAEINDQPVLIQPFTLTCPVCIRQQAEISALHATGDIPFMMVGLDIDPNSNEASLRAYTGQYGFYGLYARSPPEMTRSLADQFGVLILSPAQAPLVLVCPDNSARILSPGIKNKEQLNQTIREFCTV